MTATLSPRRKPMIHPRRFSHVVIRASAGSGKTFQLSNRYLALLSQGVPPEKILAVTFTRKAAGEIFDRIVLRLADAAADERECEQLAGSIHAENLTTDRCRELLRALYEEDPRPAYEEIAERLGMRIGSIGPTRARCLSRLRETLEEGPHGAQG